MPARLWLLATVLWVGPAGCDPAAPSACPACLVDPAELAAIPLRPGVSTHEARPATRTMTLTLAVPDRVRDGMPLVPALHYASDTGRASRVLVVGYSDGGVGTWALTARDPGRFSAGLPVASRPFGGPHGDVPLYLVHGRQDAVHPLAEVEAAYDDLQASGATASLDVIDATHGDVAAYRAALARGVGATDRVERA